MKNFIGILAILLLSVAGNAQILQVQETVVMANGGAKDTIVFNGTFDFHGYGVVQFEEISGASGELSAVTLQGSIDGVNWYGLYVLGNTGNQTLGPVIVQDVTTLFIPKDGIDGSSEMQFPFLYLRILMSEGVVAASQYRVSLMYKK